MMIQTGVNVMNKWWFIPSTTHQGSRNVKSLVVIDINKKYKMLKISLLTIDIGRSVHH